jgi:hypothetical protein
MPSRPTYLIALKEPNHAVLETWARRRKTAQALSLRARGLTNQLLPLAPGSSNPSSGRRARKGRPRSWMASAA